MTPSRRRVLFSLLGIVLVAGIAIQFVPVQRTNRLGSGDPDAPREVMWILRRACYDCHSTETRWPIWAYVAPVSWRVVDDVEKARRALNFSDWASHTAQNRAALRMMVSSATSAHRMPAWYYVTLHPDAKLSSDDLAALRRWADMGDRALPTPQPTPP
jgi:hypothetical protein